MGSNTLASIDVTDREQLERFLRETVEQDVGREQVVAFAARAALRAVPALASLHLKDNPGFAPTIVLPTLRAMALLPALLPTLPTLLPSLLPTLPTLHSLQMSKQ